MATTDMERLEWEVLRLINEARSDPWKALENRGLADKYDQNKYPPRDPLSMNVALRGAAQEHAQRMATHEDLDHYLDGVRDREAGEEAYAAQFDVAQYKVKVWSVASSAPDAEAIIYVWLESDDGHRDYILGYTTINEELYNTVLMGLGARQSESGNLYTDGLIAWVEDGFVDLYVRDNEADEGLVPTTGVTYESPDIRIRDAGGVPRENAEYGEDNYVFVTVHNAGTKAPVSFQVYLYWADPGINLRFNPDDPENDDWHEEGIGTGAGPQNWIDEVPLNPGESREVGPFIWCPLNPLTGVVRGDGHFCLLARVVCNEDPIMHEAGMPSDREYENNLAQLNVTVVDEVADGECHCSIGLCGGSKIDVSIDPGRIMQDGGRVYFRLRSRLLEEVNLQGLEVVETTPEGQFTTLGCTASGPSVIQGIGLARGEKSTAELRVKLPAAAEDGTTYPVKVSQTIDGRPVGAVTVVARMVANPAYIGNRNSGELHLPTCKWVGRMASHNKKPLSDIETAHRRGYDNCAFCLGESKR